MAFYDKFPYTNFQELNLDWLTQEVSKVRDNRDATDASAAAALASEQAAKASETAAAGSQQAAAASQQAAANSETAAAGSAAASAEYLEQIGTHTAGAVSDWLKENLQPTTPPVDATLTVSGAAADAKKTGDEISDLKDDLYAVEEKSTYANLVDPSLIEDGYVYRDSKTSGNYSISGFINIKPDTYYSFANTEKNYWDTEIKARFVSFFDGEKQYISGLEKTTTFQTPSTAKYLVLTFTLNARKVILLEGQYDYTSMNGVYVPFGEVHSIPISKISGMSVHGKNLFDIKKALLNSFLDIYPYVDHDDQYFVTDYIPIENGKKYFIPYARSYVTYDANKQRNGFSKVSTTNLILTAPADGYLRTSADMSKINRYQIEEGEAATEYEEYMDVFSESVPLLNENQLNQVGNILYKKKWAVCGDSFTNGSTEQIMIDGGKYNGMRHVYPYIIGNRNEMEIVRFFEGGRTLAFPAEPGTFDNSLTNPNADWYYQNIPEDTDYITIYLGINDEHHAPGTEGGDGEDNTGVIPIGTLEDNTPATYLGAWNVVLTWLITNRPNAHIGIIVTNGNQNKDEYRLGQIAIAQKYGIPYIDLNGDARTPAMIRTSNPNIPSAIKNALILKWRVSSSNIHPNDDAHEFESTFIENFLRSI